MLARIAGRWATHLRIRGRWISSCALWEVDISRRTSLDSPLPVQVLEASPKGHYTQLAVQPLGWYNEPLTVVMHGDDAPQRGERLFVGLQHARLYNGDERIETRDEELALAQKRLKG
ncbi:hypothetical protein ACP0HM_13045 [Escherichia coli]